MRIGELARQADVSTQTIRYYEDIGLLPAPHRQANGYRAYGPTAVDRLRFVKDAQASGLSLPEIQVILELREEGESTCGHTIRLLEAHLQDVDKQLVELGRTRSRLQKMITEARALDPAECHDPNRCQTITRQHN